MTPDLNEYEIKLIQYLYNDPKLYQLMDNFEFNDVYKTLIDYAHSNRPAHPYLDISNLTSFLMKVGINPIDYIDALFTDMWSNVHVDAIEIPATIKTIQAYAFENAKIKTITLLEGCTTVSKGMFSDSDVETIVLPKSLKYIGEYAIDYCGDHLATITYAGTAKQFINLDKHRSILWCLYENEPLHYDDHHDDQQYYHYDFIIHCKDTDITVDNVDKYLC